MSTFTNIPNSGSPEWKEAVANATLLPLYNNNIGDKRETLDTKSLYTWDGVAWIAIASPAAAIAIDGLIGDVLATGPGVVQATLANVNMTTGSFGDASHTPTITVNSKGLVTSSSQQSIQISESQVTNLVNDLAGKQPNLGFTPENVANKATNLTSPDNIKYPTTQAVSIGLSLKQDTITGAATTIVSSNLTANRALLSDNNGKVATNSVTSTELGYLSGVTSGIQSQINGKYNNPTGTTSQYIRGDGSLATLPSGGGTWGSITGALSNQTDLQTALNGKFNNPTGTAADYIAGDGSIIPFPSVAAADRLVTTVYNSTGNLVPAGSVIYLNGPHGNIPDLILAQANNETNSAQTYGIVQTNIGNMTSGIAIQEGRLDNLNTNVSGWNEGEILYLSPTIPGGITNIKATAPNHLVIVGTLVRKHPTQGVIQVKIQNGYELDELHNVYINGTLANNDTIVYDSSTFLWKNSAVLSTKENVTNKATDLTSPDNIKYPSTLTVSTALSSKLSKGTNTIFCIDNGDYATLQAAIDAAPSYPTSCTILVGSKSGGWGDIVLPANKNLSITGLSAPKSEQVVFVNSVTYSPTTGTNPVANNIHLCNLFISPQTAIQAVTFGGTAPARLRFTSCYIYGAAATSVILSNTNGVYSTSSFTDCYFDMGNTSNTHISSSLRYAVFDRCNFNSGNKAFNVTGGFIQIGLSALQVNSTNEIITISNANTLVAMANSLIQNSTTNGSGVLIGTSAYFQSINNIITVATGTGYCVRGTGIHLYGQTTTGNSAISTNNVKMQNTLTNLPYTIGLTASP